MEISYTQGPSGVRTVHLPSHADSRGVLTVVETNDDVPFAVKRIFYIYRLEPPFERGAHAHSETEQFVICVAGCMKVDVSDGMRSGTYVLNDPAVGLYIPAMIWTRLHAFTYDAVCVVVASTHYDDTEVIRSWQTYCDLVDSRRQVASCL